MSLPPLRLLLLLLMVRPLLFEHSFGFPRSFFPVDSLADGPIDFLLGPSTMRFTSLVIDIFADDKVDIVAIPVGSYVPLIDDDWIVIAVVIVVIFTFTMRATGALWDE